MEMEMLLAQYHGMNTAHLTVDELDHELKIRKMEQNASRSKLERALRNYLKEEEERSNVQFDFSNVDVVEELETCDDKLNSIKNYLESRRSKKAPDQCFKTRLIHILFRMERLKRRDINEECANSLAVVAGECVRLLNVYFSVASHLPEVRAAELAIVNGSISRMLRKESRENDREREEVEVDVAENEDESVGENLVDEIVDEGEIQRSMSDVADHNEGAVGGESANRAANDEQGKLAAENKRLLVVVSQLLQRIEALEGQQSKEQLQEKHAKTTNSTQLEVEKIPTKSSQQKPTDFLAWLKERNSSLDSSRKSTERKQVEVRSSLPGSSEKERSKSNSNRLPVHKWTIRYDGMDNGRRLNEFLKEVEFNARSEGFSEDELFLSAHHLFTHKARAWFMEVNGNYELGSWKELVRELKNEFLPIDIDYVYERQAYNRKQGTKEKFQDFYLDMVRIFRGMSDPWGDKRKFDVLFRNTREDCRIAMLAANVNDIAKMREFGKKFDAINWQLYQKRDRFSARPIQVDEVYHQRQNFQSNQNRFEKGSQDRGNENRNFSQGFNKGKEQKGFWNQRPPAEVHKNRDEARNYEKPKPKPDYLHRQKSPAPGPSETSALQRIVKAYIPIRREMCFNCHETGHSFDECRKERNVFCNRCGFPGFPSKNCPYCQAKNDQKAAQ